jgi:hypothetical protein
VVKISNEREGFKLRLQQALRSAHYSTESPTELARDFNARFEGRAVTVHAARKWLVGESIPTQDKMRALASWLSVSVEWLRFGSNDSFGDSPKRGNDYKSEDIKLVADIRILSNQDQHIVREIVRMLLRNSRSTERS